MISNPGRLQKKTDDRLRRGRLLFEGHTKRVFETSIPDNVLLEFKAEFSGLDEKRSASAPRKAALMNDIAAHIFQYLQSFRIPSHFIQKHDETQLLVARLDMIPLAVVVRNIAEGSLCGRYGIEERRELEFPVVELIYRNSQLDYPLVNESHLLAFGVSTPEEIRTTVRIATKANAVLRSFMERRRLRLVDMWMEFGRKNGEILLGDAIIPDSMRLLDTETDELHDGAIFRLGIGDYQKAYRDLHQRLLS